MHRSYQEASRSRLLLPDNKKDTSDPKKKDTGDPPSRFAECADLGIAWGRQSFRSCDLIF